MLYLLAVVLPPVAVLIAGKPLQALLNIGLCFLLFIPGVIHAWMIVSNHYQDKRTGRLVEAIRVSGQ